MDNLINKFLLAGDKFMPEIHLRQPQFTYSACGPFTRHEERIQKFKETGDTNYVFKNELDKACFVHDAAYSDSKDLTKRTIADKNLKNRAFDIAKDPKFKVGDHVRISKYKNSFAKGYMPNWSEEVFVIKKVKNTIPWTYVINNLNGEEIIGTFYEKELQKTNQEEFRIEKVIRRKGDKLYVKWKRL